MSNVQRGLAELIGTFWLVFGGCGSAVLAAAFPDVGIGLAGVSLAFGLTVLTMAYSIGHISGCHLNPAVTFGLWAGGRFPARDIPLYVIAQVIGAVIAAGLLWYVASGAPGYAGGLASNGFGEHSPGHFSFQAGMVIEVVLTFMFLMVIMGSTDSRAPAGFPRGNAHRTAPRGLTAGGVAVVVRVGWADATRASDFQNVDKLWSNLFFKLAKKRGVGSKM